MKFNFVANAPKAIADELTLQIEANEEQVSSEVGIQVGRRSKLGPQVFAICIFNPLPRVSIAKYETIHGLPIPILYRNVLEQVNGGWIFRLALFGLPPSMIAEPPVLDRSTLQPMDISTANRHWRNRFDVTEGEFHIGASDWNLDSIVGYFMSPSGAIRGLVAGNGCVAEWNDFDSFLRDEIQRSKEAYPAYEQFVVEGLRQIDVMKTARKRK